MILTWRLLSLPVSAMTVLQVWKAVAEIGQSAQYNKRASRPQDHIPIDRRQSPRAVESMLAPAVAASARSADHRQQYRHAA
jgi:hypothetical protein